MNASGVDFSVHVDIAGPNASGFHTAIVVTVDDVDRLVSKEDVSQPPSLSYNRERAIAYALRDLADRLEKSSR